MIDKKYNNLLTGILVVVVIAIIVVLAFWGRDIYERYYREKGNSEVLEEFDTRIKKKKENNTINETLGGERGEITLDVVNNTVNNNVETQNRSKKISYQTYKGFTVLGKIEIPSINLKYPVLDRATEKSMKLSVGVSYGPGLNMIGNTCISGHNFKDGTFFSNLKKVKKNEKIYITDLEGKRVKYNIYNIYYTTSTDFDYATRETAGAREVTLVTCSDDVQSRLVIWAKEEK